MVFVCMCLVFYALCYIFVSKVYKAHLLDLRTIATYEHSSRMELAHKLGTYLYRSNLRCDR